METESTLGRLADIPVIVTDALPIPVGHREDARRIVRHAYGVDFLTWCGAGPIGPKPGAPTHVLRAGGRIYVSQEAHETLLSYTSVHR